MKKTPKARKTKIEVETDTESSDESLDRARDWGESLLNECEADAEKSLELSEEESTFYKDIVVILLVATPFFL